MYSSVALSIVFNVLILKKNKKINNKNIDLKVETHNIKLFNNYINLTLQIEDSFIILHYYILKYIHEIILDIIENNIDYDEIYQHQYLQIIQMDDEMNQIIYSQIQSLKETFNQREQVFKQFLDNRKEFGLKFTQMINQLIHDLPENLQTKELNYFKDLYSNEVQQNQFTPLQLRIDQELKQNQNLCKKQQQIISEKKQLELEQLKTIKIGTIDEKECQIQKYSEQQEDHSNIIQDYNKNFDSQKIKRLLRQRPQKQEASLLQTVKRTTYYKKKLKKQVQCQFCNKRYLHYYGLVRHEQKKHNIIRHIVEEKQVKMED
ncbi:hypothetical protein pb186bvf_003651 [Paramecium bursaria]